MELVFMLEDEPTYRDQYFIGLGGFKFIYFMTTC
jgi:hypothetical protein